MAIIHRVRANGNGRTKTVELVPRRAIRLFCCECMGFNREEIKHCLDTLCPLYPYRHDGPPKAVIDRETKPSDQRQSTKTNNR